MKLCYCCANSHFEVCQPNPIGRSLKIREGHRFGSLGPRARAPLWALKTAVGGARARARTQSHKTVTSRNLIGRSTIEPWRMCLCMVQSCSQQDIAKICGQSFKEGIPCNPIQTGLGCWCNLRGNFYISFFLNETRSAFAYN